MTEFSVIDDEFPFSLINADTRESSGDGIAERRMEGIAKLRQSSVGIDKVA
jgi:hypothetical protein